MLIIYNENTLYPRAKSFVMKAIHILKIICRYEAAWWYMYNLK
jgi:hypothetical protein